MPKVRSLARRPENERENNIIVYVKNLGVGIWTGFIWLSVGNFGGPLYT